MEGLERGAVLGDAVGGGHGWWCCTRLQQEGTFGAQSMLSATVPAWSDTSACPTRPELTSDPAGTRADSPLGAWLINHTGRLPPRCPTP